MLIITITSRKLIDDILKKRQSKTSPKKTGGSSSQTRLPTTSTSPNLNSAPKQNLSPFPKLETTSIEDASGSSLPFSVFSDLTDKIANESTYSGKTAAVRKVLTKMTMENRSEEESILLLKLLLPGSFLFVVPS